VKPNAVLAHVKKALQEIPTKSRGVYVLLDLDAIPIYVGMSTDLRDRLSRHLTNHRTDAVGKHLVDVHDIGFVDYWLVNPAVALRDAEAVLARRFPETLNEQPPRGKAYGVKLGRPRGRIALLPADELAARAQTNTRISAMSWNAAKLADRIERYKDMEVYRVAPKLQIKRIYALMADPAYVQHEVGQVVPQVLPLPVVRGSSVKP
jgi:hypothetical protein